MTNTFTAALDQFLAYTDTPAWRDAAPVVLTGAGADWSPAPSKLPRRPRRAARKSDRKFAERSALWAAVAQTEADYRDLKVDGREG